MLPRKGQALRAALILFLAVSGVCSAENNLHRSVLSNHDVVTLAKAGFDENFLVNLIVSSQTRFDTGADALAALAEQGVTQRIVETMMNPGLAVPRASAPGRSAVQVAKPIRASRISLHDWPSWKTRLTTSRSQYYSVRGRRRSVWARCQKNPVPLDNRPPTTS